MGITDGGPYTAHEEGSTTRPTPAAATASSNTRPAATLLAKYISGCATDSATSAYAARCTRASNEWRASTPSSTRRSPTPPCTNCAPGSTAARWPRLRSSSTTTAWPRETSCSTTTLPMYPAPPVTRILLAMLSFQAKQLLERLQQAVPVPGLNRLLERDRGRMEKLVEQRVTELLDLGAVLGRQVREPFQDALQFRGAHLVELPAKLLQHRHHGEPAVPRPEPLDLITHDPLGGRDLPVALRGGMRRDGLEIVDVIQEDVLELPDGGLHVARHGEVEDTKRPPPAPGCALEGSQASRACPWHCGSPRIIESRPADTR